MPKQIFARAKPAHIKITETYRYHANISGNPTIEEKGQPEGLVLVELPFDGNRYLTRQAYQDIRLQYEDVSGDVSASIGHLHLAVEGLSPEEQQQYEKEQRPTHLVIPLEAPIPNEAERLHELLEDRQRAIFRKAYQPSFPELPNYPQPVQISVDLNDESTLNLKKELIEQVKLDEMRQLGHKVDFEHCLYLEFKVELALPRKLPRQPILRQAELAWPVATSHKRVYLEDERNPRQPEGFFYDPQGRGQIGWFDLAFDPPVVDQKSAAGVVFYRTPPITLTVVEPGEFYNYRDLVCHMEIELPDALLSGLSPCCFDATGQPDPQAPTQLSTRIGVDIDINLKQRFDCKVLSPVETLYFEGVMLEEARMEDIATLLKDLRFSAKNIARPTGETTFKPGEKTPIHAEHALLAYRGEGHDEILIWAYAEGDFADTERETIIPGGKSFKTTVRSGNTKLTLGALLSGNVNKLTSELSFIHLALKERFRHVSTID